MPEGKTIVILSPGFPSDEQDSTCLPAVQKFVLSANKLFPHTNLVVVAFQYPFKRTEYVWNGVSVIALGGMNRPGIQRLLTWMRAYRALNKINRSRRVDGLLGLWLGECALVAKLYGRFNKIKSYMWLHGQDARPGNSYVKRTRPKPVEVIAISQNTATEFFKNYGTMPFMVAENGIDPREFPSLNLQRNIDILGTGSLTAVKNYTLFIEVVAEVKKTFPLIRVTLAGSGPEEKKLKARAVALGLGNNVTFAGSVEHQEVLRLMNHSSVFLHTSSYEGSPGVLIEALYSGCKVVSVQSLSNKEIQNLWVRTQKQELADAIIKILNEKNQPERVLYNHMDTTAEKILSLYL